MHIILTLLRKDFARVRRDKAALSLTFIVPLALIYVFGQIFGAGGKDSGPTGIPLAVVNASDNPAAVRLIDALKAEKAFKVLTTHANADKTERPLTEADLKAMMRNNEFRFAVVLPSDLVSDKQIGLHLKILSNPRNDIETQMVTGILQKTIFTNVPQLLGQSLQARAKEFVGGSRLEDFNRGIANNIAGTFGGDSEKILADIRAGNFGLGDGGTDAAVSGDSSGGTKDFLSRVVRIENEQVVGKDVKSPLATRSVGGWAMQFLLFALTASATALFHEKEHGLFQRLLSTPATRAHILWSKFIYGVCLGLIQLVVLFVAGRFLYGIDVEHHFGLLILVSLFASAACTAFGMLLAAISPSPEAARGLGTMLILMMSAIGGAWFPVSIMPEFIQRLSKLTLVYWSLEGFQQVLWANASFTELLPTLGILAAIASGVMAIALWRFNRGKIFD
jgi:ABC-2 type transport system permease protein